MNLAALSLSTVGKFAWSWVLERSFQVLKKKENLLSCVQVHDSLLKFHVVVV